MLMSCFFPWNIFRVCFPHQWVLHSCHVALLLVSLRFAPHLLLLWPDSPGLDSLPLCYIPGGLTSGRKSKGISVLLPLRWVTSDSNWSLTGPSQRGTTLSSVVPVPSGTLWSHFLLEPRLPWEGLHVQPQGQHCLCPQSRLRAEQLPAAARRHATSSPPWPSPFLCHLCNPVPWPDWDWWWFYCRNLFHFMDRPWYRWI